MKKTLQFFKVILLIILFCCKFELMSNTIIDITELKNDLLGIHKQFLGQSRNVAIIESILNKLLNIDYQTLANQDYDTKRNLIISVFNNLAIKNYTEENDWKINDFIDNSTATGNKLNIIKNKAIANMDNIDKTELVLRQLFNTSYSELINNNYQTKKLALQMNFERLSWIPYSPFANPDSKTALYSAPDIPRTGPLVSAEIETLFKIKKDTGHFKYLKLVKGQLQKGVTCGSHAIINAWAIEQLLNTDEDITASNIFKITQPYFIEGSKYPIDRFIDSTDICTQVPKFITQSLERTNFESRVNFMAYHNLDKNIGVHYTEKPHSPNWFLNIGDITLMRPQIKALLTLPPHIEHFIYNTGGHWILASVVQKPGEQTIIYFIDSAGAPAISLNNTPVNRFVIALYKNFVEAA